MLDSPYMLKLTKRLAVLLESLGVPPPYPEPDQIALCVTAVLTTLLLYFLLFGKRHRLRRKMLAKDLREARKKVQELEEKLLEMEVKEEGASPKGNQRPVRIWMDGCFDMMHYGHMNAFRQGKALGTFLVVGVNSDATITACKGPPVMNDEERLAAVEGCRFVDEVVPDVPYVMDEAYLKRVMEKYRIDFVVHGDDPCIVNGRDVYEVPQKMGKYRTIPRTEGVSTTDIVGRMLLMSRRHHQRTESTGSQTGQLASEKKMPKGGSQGRVGGAVGEAEAREQQLQQAQEGAAFYRRSRFLTTSRMIRLFSAGMRAGPPHRDSKVVYIDGSWDMFHAGHIKTLKKIKEGNGSEGIFLIVGVHNDQVRKGGREGGREGEECLFSSFSPNSDLIFLPSTPPPFPQVVNAQRGSNFPIMNLHERVLSVLGCKYVDDVLIDAPYKVTREMIASLNLSLVLHGAHRDENDEEGSWKGDGREGGAGCGEEDPFAVPKEMGIFGDVSSDCALSVREIISRIQKNQELFVAKYSKKKVAEDEYYSARYAIEGEKEGGKEREGRNGH